MPDNVLPNIINSTLPFACCVTLGKQLNICHSFFIYSKVGFSLVLANSI